MANTFNVLGEIAAHINKCRLCNLCESRNVPVPGEGNPQARLMFIGEGPGDTEDQEGLPFIGRSGQLLDEAFKLADIDRSDVFITNVVKCRPPGNRNPTQQEMDSCLPYLSNQISFVRPNIIVVLGKVAAEYLLQRPVKITQENGILSTMITGLKVMPVLHPAYVLRNQKPEIRESFFQAIKNARNIAYGISYSELHAGSIR